MIAWVDLWVQLENSVVSLYFIPFFFFFFFFFLECMPDRSPILYSILHLFAYYNKSVRVSFIFPRGKLGDHVSKMVAYSYVTYR